MKHDWGDIGQEMAVNILVFQFDYRCSSFLDSVKNSQYKVYGKLN